jgi:hypothetical protein
MHPLRVHPALVGGIADLSSLFISLGRYRGIAREDVERTAALVPESIKQAPCFLDRLTGLWRYDFGEHVILPDGSFVFGTNAFQPVDRLYDVLACARRRLPINQLNNYLARLADPRKHDDFLFEFAPILRLPVAIEVSYEVPGHGEGNRTVDWFIQPTSGPPIALEVKNRIGDLVESLTRAQAGVREADGSAPVPIHDPSLLFVDLESKYGPCAPTEIVHVGWIGTDVKQEEAELKVAFGQVDQERIHVGLLGDWEDDVYTLSHDADAREHVMRVLGVRESRRFVFCRNED